MADYKEADVFQSIIDYILNVLVFEPKLFLKILLSWWKPFSYFHSVHHKPRQTRDAFLLKNGKCKGCIQPHLSQYFYCHQ